MVKWFRDAAEKKSGQNEMESPTQNILERLSELEKALVEIQERLEDTHWSIDKVIIEKMHADKVEFNLDKIDVRDLSGMLSIGMNYGGKQIKMEAKPSEKTEKKQPEKKEQEKKPNKPESPSKTETGNGDKASNNSNRSGETLLSMKNKPVIKMIFK